MNKKVLLSVVAAGLVATTTAPVVSAYGNWTGFQNGGAQNTTPKAPANAQRNGQSGAESNNGGANVPRGPQDTMTPAPYYNQTEFVNADKVNEYVAAHSENINANKAKLDAAKAALAKAENAPENFAHNRAELLKPFQDAVAAAQGAYDAEVAKVRNEAIKNLQKVHNTANKIEGRYYILNETPEQANARYLKEHGLDKDGNKVVTDKNGNDVVVDKDGKPVLDKNGKPYVVRKANKKVLPNTHAAK